MDSHLEPDPYCPAGTRPCPGPGCGGTLVPIPDTCHIDAGDGGAMVSTRCNRTCGMSSSHHWAATDAEYEAAIGYRFGETDPSLTGEVTTAEEWAVLLTEWMYDHRHDIWDATQDISATSHAVGVPVAAVMIGRGGSESLITAQEKPWTIRWNPTDQRWQ